MAVKQQKGPCWLCGQELSRSGMGRHLLAKHPGGEGDQPCMLLKIQDESGAYCLYADLPLTSTLKTLDTFLRDVWCECCGHMSAFMAPRSWGDDYSMSRKIGAFEPGESLRYEYDFGSTTTLYVTFVQKTARPKQKAAVRLLARNNPYAFVCCECGKPAEWVNAEGWDRPFYCDGCARDMLAIMLPVVNSPRMGVCGYTGEFDRYQYVPGGAK